MSVPLYLRRLSLSAPLAVAPLLRLTVAWGRGVVKIQHTRIRCCPVVQSLGRVQYVFNVCCVLHSRTPSKLLRQDNSRSGKCKTFAVLFREYK